MNEIMLCFCNNYERNNVMICNNYERNNVMLL